MSTVSDMPEEVTEPLVEQLDDFIDQRLERTSFHLKTLDLVTGLIWLGLVLFGSLLVVVIIDHWIVGLGVGARIVALIAVTAATLFLGISRVLMPLVKSINPEYAALTVEHAHPELKNGLISFLFFRDRPDLLRKGVYQGVQQQAATDLTAVPIDSAIDRSAIIKLGYCLVALAAIWVGYILLSPKNPLQTLQRVAMPWRDIARPSQVDIVEVTPGNIEIYRGQSVDIKAKILGLKSDSPPSLVFSTLDRQLVDQRIPLSSSDIANRFVGRLTINGLGIQQDIEYRIQAGDAMSQRYEVLVTDAPHILVDRLQFDYPDYTGLDDEIVQGEGDIRAIEGTTVTVFGKANQPIQRGHIEFVPSAESTSSAPIRASLKQTAKPATTATVRFPLRMNAERDAGVYRAYQLHFTNEAGLPSVDPIEHSIEVIADLRPVVEILTPETRTIELPENSWQQIEVRAVDPDYKLTRVQLAARTRGRNLFRESMLATSRSSEWHTGQFTAIYRFVPRDYGLRDGDVVEYVAVAEDNRHAMNRSQLDPNRTITAKQYIRIVKPDPMAEKPPEAGEPEGKGNPENSNPNEEPQDQQNSGGEPGQPNERQEDQTRGGDEQDSTESQEQGESGSKSETGDQSEEPSGDSQGEQSGLQEDGQSGGDTQQQSEGGSPGESNDSESDQQSQGESTGDQQANPNDTNQPSQPSAQEQNSDPGSGGESDAAAGDNSSQNNAGGQQGESGQPQGENATGEENHGRGATEDEPLPSTGERDGEVIERIREHMKKQGELEQYEKQQQQEQEQEQSQSGDRQDATADSSSDPNDPGPQDRDDEPTGGGQQPDGNRGDTTPPNDKSGGKTGERDQEPGDQKPGDNTSGKQDAGSNPAPGDESNSAQGNQPSASQSKNPTSNQQPTEGEPATDKSQQNSRAPGSDASEQSTEQGSEATETGNPQDTTGDRGDSSNSKKPQNDTNDTPESGEKPGEAEDSNDASEKQSDSEKGAGSPKSQAGDESQPGESQPADPADETPPSNQSGSSESASGNPNGKGQDSQSPSNKSTKQGQPSGDGQSGTSQEADTTDPNAVATGDDANLEYTRKATDLVLEYLRDQKQEPDPELLDELGWKQEDVDKFVRRWDKMKQNAQGNDPVAQKNKSKLDELLKGMGLESTDSTVRRTRNQDDRQRDNRNTGRQQKVPAELLNPFRAFQRGLQQKRQVP